MPSGQILLGQGGLVVWVICYLEHPRVMGVLMLRLLHGYTCRVGAVFQTAMVGYVA
jgi:hypothetical protein